MPKLFWIGNPYFAEDLKACGWEKVHIHPFFKDYELFTWQKILNLAGFVPDVVVVADNSLPPFVVGMEKFPCLTVFYAVDSHIHSWHPVYAQAFDACMVSLADHLGKFAGSYLQKSRIFWSPPYARNTDRPDNSIFPEWDCLFVGNVDKKLLPDRVQFLEEVLKLVPGLVIRTGHYSPLFPRGKTVLNHAINHDLNFRVFEAMACGACLVTPLINNGLETLFKDGVHFVGYAPDDPGDAASKINGLLRNPELMASIRKAAYIEADAKHRARNRAEMFTKNIRSLYEESGQDLIERRKSISKEILKNFLSILYILWAQEMPEAAIKQQLLLAARGELY